VDLARAGAGAAGALTARELLGVARMESAGAVAHGSGAGSAIDRGLIDAGTALRIIHTPETTSTSEPMATLVGRYVEQADGVAPSADTFALTVSRDECPREPAFVSIDVESGVPVRANGIEMSLLELLDSLDTIGGAHGVGRREGTTAEGHRYYSEGPASAVLEAVFAALPPGGSGSVRLRLLNGECTVVASAPGFRDPGNAIRAPESEVRAAAAELRRPRSGVRGSR
jgi:argininosuccinate synthase